MENLQTVLEKILTLNINANTNINIEAIVSQVVLFDMVAKVSVAFLGSLTILLIAFMVYRAHIKTHELTKDEKALEKFQKIMESFSDWRRFEELQKTVQEVRDYMPRNKKPRR